MKKTLVIFIIAVTAVGLAVFSAFAGAALVKAQTPTSEPNQQGGRGWMMGGQAMAEYMHAALADQLDISLDDLNKQITAGKTVWQIAQDQGLTDAEIATLIQDARSAALDQMVADGKITQSQADLMKQHGPAMMGVNGSCPMAGGDEDGRFFGGRGMMGGGGMMGRGR
jgi:hypothetical protein